MNSIKKTNEKLFILGLAHSLTVLLAKFAKGLFFLTSDFHKNYIIEFAMTSLFELCNKNSAIPT